MKIFIFFFTIGCTTTHYTTKTTLIRSNKGGGGGNPEVKVHHPHGIKNNTKRQLLHQIFLHNINQSSI